MSGVETIKNGDITVVTITRPEVRNAVDRPTADALANAFADFDSDDDSTVAILAGSNGTFCAGADLGAIGDPERGNRLAAEGDGPMGPTRMMLSKPVIAAIEGHAVAGGLELALWCDLRVASRTAVFGVFSRRWGVPLIDGGTIRLPRLIGHGRALDLILTGRPVPAEEALAVGLADRVVDKGKALSAALDLARKISAFPQACVRSDRLSAIEQWDLDLDNALHNEFERGRATIETGETAAGAERFRSGAGRHGEF